MPLCTYYLNNYKKANTMTGFCDKSFWVVKFFRSWMESFFFFWGVLGFGGFTVPSGTRSDCRFPWDQGRGLTRLQRHFLIHLKQPFHWRVTLNYGYRVGAICEGIVWFWGLKLGWKFGVSVLYSLECLLS